MAPAALVIMIWLNTADERRLAFWWGGLFIVAMALTVVTKVAFIGWGIGIASLNFTGFSGHALRAAAVFPVLFYLISQKLSSVARLAVVSCGYAIAFAIGISRLVLHMHSVSEVVSGEIVGCIVSLGFLWLADSGLRNHVLTRDRLAVSVGLLLAVSFVGPAPTQDWLTEASLYLSGHDKPFGRT